MTDPIVPVFLGCSVVTAVAMLGLLAGAIVLYRHDRTRHIQRPYTPWSFTLYLLGLEGFLVILLGVNVVEVVRAPRWVPLPFSSSATASENGPYLVLFGVSLAAWLLASVLERRKRRRARG